jgi:hypothetical protein
MNHLTVGGSAIVTEKEDMKSEEWGKERDREAIPQNTMR